MKRYILLSLIITVYCENTLLAAPSKTVYSRVANASWTTNTHWSLTSGGASCGCVPDESKDVIYVRTNTSAATGISFGSSVTLHVLNGATLTIAGNTSFSNGAIININTGGRIIINGNITNNNNSNQVTIDGTLTVNGNFTGGNGSTITGTGSMSTTGTASSSGSGSVFGSTGECTIGPCSETAISSLPIELIAFDASVTSDKLNFNWSTATETNNDFFTLERTLDGAEFEVVETFKSKALGGNSSVNLKYNGIDVQPHNGISYYRLKQTDFNGQFTYSQLITVNFEGGAEFSLNIYPNPNDGSTINVVIHAVKTQDLTINVYDLSGKKCYSQQVATADKGDITYALNPENKLTAGMYIIEGRSQQSTFRNKFFVK